MAPQDSAPDPALAAALEAAERLEQQLRHARKMEALGLLAGGIAHDFNNLLTIINGYNHLLLTSCELPEDARKFLGIARDAGKRAAALVRGLMALSRNAPAGHSIIDLNDSARELDSLVSRLLPPNIQFSMLLEPQLKTVLAEPGGVQQVLLNLVFNSRDAMPEGGKLEIHTANVLLDAESAAAHPYLPMGEYVMLAVSDTGAGMDEETRRRLFEPLYTTKPHGVGTGLGLSTVLHIVKQSQGFLSVQSEQGSGSTIRIYLPTCAGEKTPEVVESEAAPPGGNETILIAEDNLEVRALLRTALEELGYSILESATAKEAAQLSSGFPGGIHLLIADLVLPDSTGIELAQQLQVWHPGLPVLHISGYGEGSAFDSVQESGGEFLAKPFSLAAFAGRIRGILDRRKRRRILFVDDDPDVALFASRVLGDAGFEVLLGGNGNVALETAQAEHLDLVITDLVMPEREGLETIMRLRKSYPSLPIIAISGAFGGHFLKGAATLGARATLPKPFSGEELLTAVRVVLCL